MFNFLKKKKRPPREATRIEMAEGIYNHHLEQKRLYSNRDFIIKRYIEMMGHEPNLENPRLLTEKIQWIKLYYNNPLYTKCSDKYAVREYVEDKGYAHILNDLIGVYTNVDDIRFDELPDRFVLKAAHGCSWNFLCTDKSKESLQWEETKLLLAHWLKEDFALYSRELHYAYIPPRLICERFLENEDGSEVKDYKIHCFHGEPKLIQVDYGRFMEHQRNYYDVDWNLLDIRWVDRDNYPGEENRPHNLDKMLAVARALSADFCYVRVDLYNVSGKVIFGELTFTSGSGFTKLEPEKMDAVMGSWLTLPIDSEYVIK